LPGRRATALTAATIAVGALAVYRTTLLPGVGAWDTAEAQAALPLLGTMHPTGFPAYAILGWIASVVLGPLGEPAFRVNLLSALLVAGAVGAMVPLLRRFDVPLPIAAAGAAGLALTPITWAIASAADAHALHVALVMVLALTLVRWERLVDERRARPDAAAAATRADRGIVLTAVVFGVALANHGLTLLLVPAIGLYVLAVDPGVLRRPRLVGLAGGACAVVAALLYLELPVRAGPFPAPLVYGHPETWDGFWQIVLARQFQGDVGAALGDLPSMLANLAAFTTTQLGALAALVVPAFIVTAVRFPRYALLSGVATIVTCVFAASYLNAAIGRYYLGPALFAWTWLAIAAATVVRVVLGRASAGASDPFAADEALARPAAPGRPAARTSVVLALCAALLVPTGLGLSARWHAVDRSGDTAHAAWLDDAMAGMDPDAVVVSWWSSSTTLWYGTLVEGRRPDLLIVDDSDLVYEHLGSAEDVIDSYLGRRPVLVIRSSASDIDALAVRYVLEPLVRPAGVYRVTGPREAAP
jgi:hypothetical protein